MRERNKKTETSLPLSSKLFENTDSHEDYEVLLTVKPEVLITEP